MSLFRKEVVTKKQQKLYGSVVIPTNISYVLLSSLAGFFLIILVVVAIFGKYSRSEKAVGHLMPTKGLIKIQTLKPGVLTHLHVRQGDRVSKGAFLASFEAEAVGMSGRSVQQSGIDALLQKITLLDQKRLIGEKQFKVGIDTLVAEEKSGLEDLEALITKLALQRELVSSAERTYNDSASLRKAGHISSVEFESRRQFYLQAKQALATFEREQTQVRNQIANLNLSKTAQHLDHEKTLSQIETEMVSLQQQVMELEGDQQFKIKAPVDGIVASILVTEGRNIDRREPIITLLPAGGELQAELYVPSRAIGFIKEGQVVQLAYDAFPYQQYGKFDAEIVSITKTMLLPEETRTGLALTEPVYRVQASVFHDFVQAGAERLSLQTGMRVDATIILEKRSFLGWFLKSVNSLEGLG